MPFISISIPAGVVKADSPLAASGRWIDADKVRFRRGMPEKIGGTQKLIEDTFDGYVRGAKAWTTYRGDQDVLFGTAAYLYIIRNGVLTDITPFRVEGITLTNPFTTTNLSTTVTVTDVDHGITSVGTRVVFDGASAVGGITIDGTYAVASIVDDDTFTIVHTAPASSAATGGGTVTASYYINVGLVDPEYLTGWGIGLWGYSYWGTPVSVALGILVEPLVWSMDNYGEDLILCPLDGSLFYFDSSAGAAQPTIITNAPAQVRATFVTAERYIFALGCTTIAGSYDKMTVRWPDIEDFTVWTPSSTNTANERKLQGGSRLVGGCNFMQGLSLVWSDACLFSFQFTGLSTIYDTKKVADECGLAGPHAWCKSDNAVFWMSDKSFHFYNGSVSSIPNVSDIVDWVFDNINTAHAMKSFAFYNKQFNEVWFVYPVTSNEPDTYVMVNLDDFSWANGTWARTAATKFPVGESRPILFGLDGYAWLHETPEPKNDDSSPMEAYIESALIDIDDGNTCVDIWGFVPDFQTQSGDLSVYLYGKDHPRDDVVMSETITVTEDDAIVDTRIAGRQFGMKIISDTLGGDFRLGKTRLEISGAGKKRSSRSS